MRVCGLKGLLLAATLAQAVPPMLPYSGHLAPGLLNRGEYELGFTWMGPPSWEQSQFRASAAYGITDRLDAALIMAPTENDRSVGFSAELGMDWIRAGNWTFGTMLGVAANVGEATTFHFDHGEVRHRMQSAGLDFMSAWKWVYFGIGPHVLRDGRTYDALRGPVGEPYLYADRGPEESLFAVQERVGVTFGEEWRFGFEILLMDERVYNLAYEPSEPIFSSPFSYAMSIAWSPSRGRTPGAPPLRKTGSEPSAALLPPSRPYFNADRYWRLAGVAAIGSAIGLATGLVIGSRAADDAAAFFPPEFLYAMAGAVIGNPVGSLVGAYSHQDFRHGARVHAWTLGGTAVGFGASLVLAPVTAGASLFLVSPLGTVLGWRMGEGE